MLRVQFVIDDFSEECLGTLLTISSRASALWGTGHRSQTCGYPVIEARDNGTELTSDSILNWHEERLVGWRHIA